MQQAHSRSQTVQAPAFATRTLLSESVPDEGNPALLIKKSGSGLGRVTASAQVPAAAPAPKPDIEGLNVFLPQPDAQLRREREFASLDNDILQWKKATAEWEDNFTKQGGGQAVDAVRKARDFHQQLFEPLRRKYADNPEAANWLREEGSNIANRSIGYMNEFSRRETERYLEATLNGEERELRRLVASDNTLDELKKRSVSRLCGQSGGLAGQAR